MTEQDEHSAALALAGAAQQALQNTAIMAYFNEVEAKAIDAMLLAGPTQDIERLRLSVVAQTIRQMKAFLQDARESGAYAEEMLKRIEKEAT